ncbi:hypothetical protein IVG45_14630 [Methylomonas sp. LL1]|uniref:hypothetical protein n=1 Tax=Methylomonas sp. LL1 TaxID=2785785 RepID=UPI0018C4411C|nr:hypothetical protein [Methylomonas sp. LL1]QPK62090.1 hypothetical protein IVG45_14630 [Methylomonas sp. LL1]
MLGLRLNNQIGNDTARIERLQAKNVKLSRVPWKLAVRLICLDAIIADVLCLEKILSHVNLMRGNTVSVDRQQPSSLMMRCPASILSPPSKGRPP